ncbi:amidohydrolase [Salipiger sp. P9]|uniref:amidohydrolase n=1 Tax=Salipiger pentaromativorans TaxID=2943193 RepID=UPI002158A147|nr:amidohydrolase [Salipiger pentaromativorans]MCR8549159.1 amidohydrolase [Salipiger pentaromativorans]
MSTTIFHNGSILTMEDGDAPEAVAIDGGYICAVGALGDVRAVCPDAVEVDLKGRALLPGFIDAHSHPLWAAKTRGAPVVDIRAETVPTYAAIVARIKRRVAAAAPGEHLIFFGLDPTLHPDMENPTRAFLDTLAPDNPIGIQTSNCHALFLNSAGFAACGIDETTPTPTGSIVERDETGRPTGRIAEAITWTALETFYEAWGEDRLAEEFQAQIAAFLRNGITTVTEHLYMPFYKASYRAALRQGLPMPRMAAYQQATAPDMAVEKIADPDDRFWMAGVKIHADGSVFIGNIWVTEPYLDTRITRERMNLKPGHVGGPNYPQAFFETMLRQYFAQGWQMTVHTQGDRTIDMVLDVLEQILAETPRDDHRFRLEHCALMRADQIERARRLGVLCSFFINHITHWGAPIEDALFGPDRAAHYMPVGSAVAAGMRVSLHADTPMTDASALELVQVATARLTKTGRCIGPTERIDVETALRSVTIDAAYQIRMEDRLGSIRPGKRADLVILEDNPLTAAPDRLRDIPVVATYLDGMLVHGG